MADKPIVSVEYIAKALSDWIKSDCPCTCKACNELRSRTGGVRIATAVKSADPFAKFADVFFNGRKA